MKRRKSFCDYVFLEILSRLPVKSLCRFRCVSEQWKSLIQHPYVTNTTSTKDNASLKLQITNKRCIKNKDRQECYSIDRDGKATKLKDRYVHVYGRVENPILNSNGLLYRRYESGELLHFSFATEEFSFIDLPSEVRYCSHWRSEIIKVDNSFCLVVTLMRPKTSIGVWMLKDDNSWVSMMKNITLSLEDTELTRESILGPICQFFGGNTKISILVHSYGVPERYIFEYNILSGKLKRLKVTGLPIPYPNNPNYYVHYM